MKFRKVVNHFQPVSILLETPDEVRDLCLALEGSEFEAEFLYDLTNSLDAYLSDLKYNEQEEEDEEDELPPPMKKVARRRSRKE